MWAAEEAQFGLVEAVVGITPLMGGTQRMAERAGTARAREFVMTGGLYDAARLLRVGRGQPRAAGGRPAGEVAQVRRPARRRADRRARRRPSAIVRAQADHGTRGADERTADLTSHLFETEDARGAVASFLEHGPGKATFEGR